MKATLLGRTRIIYSEHTFAELVIWTLPSAAKPSSHPYKYRLAYVANGRCVLRYDNEIGKGDHRHYGFKETAYRYRSLTQLIADFEADIERWNNENRNL